MSRKVTLALAATVLCIHAFVPQQSHRAFNGTNKSIPDSFMHFFLHSIIHL